MPTYILLGFFQTFLMYIFLLLEWDVFHMYFPSNLIDIQYLR